MMQNAIATITRIDEKVISMERGLAAHFIEDTTRFERSFTYNRAAFDKLELRFDKLDEKIQSLWDLKNKQEGAFGFGKWVAGVVGGTIVLIADQISKHV